MKTILPVLFLLLASLTTLAQSAGEKYANNLNHQQDAFKTSFIDMTDTVVFDLSQAVINGNHVDIPVYFLSDELINAVDFSLKYDHAELQYDTITDLTNYLLPYSHYDPNDSTIRFTSSSLPVITNDTPLVMVSFTMLSPPINSSDLNTLKGYLNGFTCSVKVIDPLPAGINDPFTQAGSVLVYPNPANDIIMFESDHDATVRLFDMQGRMVINAKHVSFNRKQTINVSGLPNGIYTISICEETTTCVSKLLICH